MKEPALYLVKIGDDNFLNYQYLGNKISIYDLNNSLSKSLTRLNHNDYIMLKEKGGTIVYREGKKDTCIINLQHFDFNKMSTINIIRNKIKKIIQVLDRYIKINKVLNE